jgi:hypothetical protein
MRDLMRAAAIMTALLITLSVGTAWGTTEVGHTQAASGIVVAVTPASKTIVMESTLGGQPWIIGAEATDQTRFEGNAKGLEDLQPGSRVMMKWLREQDRLVARSVTVR